MQLSKSTINVSECTLHVAILTVIAINQAVLLGSVALGALYCGDTDTATSYMEESRSHVRDCFDAVIPETVACYILLVLFYLHSLDNARVFRYMGFAQQSFGELSGQVSLYTNMVAITMTAASCVRAMFKSRDPVNMLM